METKKLNTRATGLIQNSKRRYLICYLSAKRPEKLVISPISQVRFFSPTHGYNIAQTFGLPIAKPARLNTRKAKASKIKSGRSKRNCGKHTALEN